MSRLPNPGVRLTQPQMIMLKRTVIGSFIGFAVIGAVAGILVSPHDRSLGGVVGVIIGETIWLVIVRSTLFLLKRRLVNSELPSLGDEASSG